MKKYLKTLTKKFLIREYTKNKNSIYKIAQMAGCSVMTVSNYLKKYNIPIRNATERQKLVNRKGKNSWNYNPECHKNHYCKEKNCHNQISYNCWKTGQRRCEKCAGKIHSKKYTGKNNYNYKGDKAVKRQKHYCKEPNCTNEICYDTWKTGRGNCHSCSKKTIKNYKYNPECHEIHRCIGLDCNNKISYSCFKNGSKLCNVCSNKGKNNPNYIHGQANFPYPPEFNDKLKQKIRKRDNYQCQKCNITEEEHLIVYGVNLSVHHIDYNKQNCKEGNLVTVCIECNARVNYNRKHWKQHFQTKVKV